MTSLSRDSKNLYLSGCPAFFLFKVLLLTRFKHGSEDEECPVPEEVRDTLGEFHNDLLLHCGKMLFSSGVNGFSDQCFRLSLGHSLILHIGIHIEEEAEEEEVDTSLRGRLLSLVDKIKSLRKKNEEEKPEVEEEPKPSK